MKKKSVSLDSSIPIPEFSLPSTEGGRKLSTSDFSQRNNLVILFLHSWSCDSCRLLLHSLEDRADLFNWLDAQVLAIIQEPLAKLAAGVADVGPGITLLADEDGKVTSQYREWDEPMDGGDNRPMLVIADRFGAMFTKMVMDEGEEIDFHEVESTLMFIATQCPECGRPAGDTMPRS